jgi:hypothetical protein
MSTITWRGDTPAVAQITTATPANVEVDDIFTLTINGKSISFTATAATVANVTDGLTTAWNASTIAEFTEVTATDSTTHVTLTGDIEGVPFTVTSSTTDGGGTNNQTLTVSTTTAATGPNDVSATTNYSGGALPGDGDTLVLENSAVSLLYNLEAMTAYDVNLTVRASFTGYIGLPETNTYGYNEYRPTYLAIGHQGTITVNIGEGDGNASGRIKVASGASALTNLNVYKAGAAVESGVPALLWKGGSSSSVVNVLSGSLGIAFFAGETAGATTLTIGYANNQSTDAQVWCGSGLTMGGTAKKNGGILYTAGALSTIKHYAGTWYHEGGSGATITSLTIEGGTCYYRSTGTVTTLKVGNVGVIDYRTDGRGRTVTTPYVYAGGAIYDPKKTVTWSSAINLMECGLMEVTLDLGKHVTVTVVAS